MVPNCTTVTSTAVPAVNGVIRLVAGNSTTLTCGSLNLKVASGPIDLLLEENLTITIPASAEVHVAKTSMQELEIRNESTSGAAIEIKQDTGTVSLTPGNTTAVTIGTPNAPPVANVGTDQTASIGSDVTLDGSGSFDPEGEPIAYHWAQEDGPPVVLLDAESPQPRFHVEESGVYEFSLVVTDGLDASAPVKVRVGVNAVQTQLQVCGFNYPETPQDRAVFSVDVSGPVNPSGTFSYSYERKQIDLVSSLVKEMSIIGNRFFVEGDGSLNGVPGYTFVAVIDDGTLGSIGAEIRSSDGGIVFTAEPQALSGRCDNTPPNAQCRNVTVPTDPGICSAALASVDNGSSDPNGDPITLAQVPAGPYNLGTSPVTLIVSDNN